MPVPPPVPGRFVEWSLDAWRRLLLRAEEERTRTRAEGGEAPLGGWLPRRREKGRPPEIW